jgi:hypothetical protein
MNGRFLHTRPSLPTIPSEGASTPRVNLPATVKVEGGVPLEPETDAKAHTSAPTTEHEDEDSPSNTEAAPEQK